MNAAHSLHEMAQELTRLQQLERQLLMERGKLLSCQTRVTFLKNASDSQLRLIGGEMTDQEMRTVRAFLNYILP